MDEQFVVGLAVTLYTFTDGVPCSKLRRSTEYPNLEYPRLSLVPTQYEFWANTLK